MPRRIRRMRGDLLAVSENETNIDAGRFDEDHGEGLGAIVSGLLTLSPRSPR